LTSPQLDGPRVGLSANCPLSCQPSAVSLGKHRQRCSSC